MINLTPTSKIRSVTENLPRSIAELEELILGQSLTSLMLQHGDEINKARKEGYESGHRDAEAKQEERIQHKILRRLNSAISVGMEVVKRCNESLPHLVIQRYMANISGSASSVTVIFVIDTCYLDEVTFSGLVADVAAKVSHQEAVFAEIFFINRRNKEIDFGILKQDYPVEFNPTLTKATR